MNVKKLLFRQQDPFQTIIKARTQKITRGDGYIELSTGIIAVMLIDKQVEKKSDRNRRKGLLNPMPLDRERKK